MDWCDLTYTPFTKKVDPGTVDFGGDRCGHIHFICSHAVKRPYRGAAHRPLQRVNYTGCTSRVNICQQRDSGDWKITTTKLEHSEVYGTYKQVRNLTEEDLEFVNDLVNNAKIQPRNLATCLSNRTGFSYTPKDAQNIIDKLTLDGLYKNF